MKATIKVDNIKCGGCANSIHKSLASVNGVFGADVDLEAGEITVDHTDEVTRVQLAAKLLSMGYPERGSVKGLRAVTAGARSYVSCAVGRINKNNI